MKKRNSISEFTSERNAALVANFHKQLARQSRIDLERAFKDAVAQEAPRFWVSEHRAAVVIARMLKGEEDLSRMYEEKRAMYQEIFRRVKALRKKRPEAPVSELVEEVINAPAPSSYMSWQRAKGIIYAEKRRRRPERRLR